MHIARAELNMDAAAHNFDQQVILPILAVIPPRHRNVVSNSRNVTERRYGERKAGVLVRAMPWNDHVKANVYHTDYYNRRPAPDSGARRTAHGGVRK